MIVRVMPHVGTDRAACYEGLCGTFRRFVRHDRVYRAAHPNGSCRTAWHESKGIRGDRPFGPLLQAGEHPYPGFCKGQGATFRI